MNLWSRLFSYPFGRGGTQALALGLLAATLAAPVRAQTVSQGAALPYPLTVYVQAADARFDSYFYAKRIVFSDRRSESIEDFFFIPHPRSTEREREFAAWRRQFRFIVSAA